MFPRLLCSFESEILTQLTDEPTQTQIQNWNFSQRVKYPRVIVDRLRLVSLRYATIHSRKRMVMWLAIFLISHGIRLKGLQLVNFSFRIGSADRFISGIQTCSIRNLFLESVKSTTSFRTNGILKPMFMIKITIKYRISLWRRNS